MIDIPRSHSDYENIDTISRAVNVDRALRQTFRPIDNDRYRNFNMCVSDKQWDEEIKQALLDDNRPANTYNLISQVVKLISGKERGGRKKLQVIGRTGEDHYSAKWMNKVLDWALSQNMWDYQKTRAVLDAIIARWGVVYDSFSFEDDPLGLPVVKRINPFRLRFDLDFTDITMKDCNFIEDRSWLTLEEILMKYALDKQDLWEEIESKAKVYLTDDVKKNKNNYVGTILERLDGASNYIRNEGYGRNNSDYRDILKNLDVEYFDPISNRFEVIDFHERVVSKQWHLFDPWSLKKYNVTDIVKTKDSDFDNDKYQLLRQGFEDPSSLKLTRAASKKIHLTTVIPALNLVPQDKPYAIQNGNFMFSFFFAYDFHSDISETQSVVDEIIDPQSDYNKSRSYMLEIIGHTANRGWTGSVAAIKGHEEDWKNPRPGKMKMINTGFAADVKADDIIDIPAGLYNVAQEGKMLVEELGSAPKAARGMAENKSESGNYFTAKAERADDTLVYLFDNISFSSMQVGRNIIDIIQKYVTQERQIRINSDFSEPEFITINERMWNGIVMNDVTLGKYDLEVSLMPYGKTDRELEYLKLNDIVKMMAEINPQAAALALPILVKASDTPYRDELMTIMEQITGMATVNLQQEAVSKLFATIKAYLDSQNQQNTNQQGKITTESMQQEKEMDGMLINNFKNASNGTGKTQFANA